MFQAPFLGTTFLGTDRQRDLVQDILELNLILTYKGKQIVQPEPATVLRDLEVQTESTMSQVLQIV